jgi:catechol 2,3-dioxygenase-like lactoylglutathione lyase family enzyme
MPALPITAVHHITLNGADRQTSMDFWQNIMGMPFVAEQPNLDDPKENHLYFNPGDDRLITVFTNEDRKADATRTSDDPGDVHHIAFEVSQDHLSTVMDNLTAHNIAFAGPKDRGFMDSIYFRDPLGLLIEIAAYTFTPPKGESHASVISKAFDLRKQAGAAAISREHVKAAVAALS